MTIFSTQKQDGFWHGSVVFVDEEKKRLIQSGKTPSGNGVDGIAQVFTMESVFKSISKWKFSQIL
ncbi:MAG: hypothetical protein SOX40_08485 [Bacteroidaceae bacterium]|nr:hypothetical protein [Bacteroidaceae bacterium]